MQLQLAFTKKIEIKNQLYIAKADLRKILEDNHEYVEVMEKISVLKQKAKQILLDTKQSFPKLADDIDRLVTEQKEQNDLVSDLAVKDYLDAKTITIDDPANPEYQWEPELKVKYKRVQKEQKPNH